MGKGKGVIVYEIRKSYCVHPKLGKVIVNSNCVHLQPVFRIRIEKMRIPLRIHGSANEKCGSGSRLIFKQTSCTQQVKNFRFLYFLCKKKMPEINRIKKPTNLFIYLQDYFYRDVLF